jgi:3-methyladenine DNA glycosylase AlkD
MLLPVLSDRTPFAKLDLIGQAIGDVQEAQTFEFVARVAAGGTDGGWAVVGSALQGQLDGDLRLVLDICRDYIASAEVWYAADILGERVAGSALLMDFKAAIEVLRSWRTDANVWVRRAVGVAVHLWAKRSHGSDEFLRRVEELLHLLEPMFGEWEMAAVKGIGWGLKTLGRHYPDLVAKWLESDIVPAERRHRTLMLRKAMTYLSPAQRARISKPAA